eukprot:CAMPEP_0177291338 /NCGR_PEP_ID=MMETSP0367-20130122/76212_1 /TAXON_ID=447022 ORGANISM="Scrippsiella hangoei-like, Strain SHHI-4" /NCGR_SAMPLE_ID=MMETSP0367 /ASSEMBLY_ACC=CAM_ASM_000362 /LENGTH=207 /DNA_ID=CAMNT_0018748863 /DNA_START=145 /DNA_END=769 /DNA_ORIENTATION=+
MPAAKNLRCVNPAAVQQQQLAQASCKMPTGPLTIRHSPKEEQLRLAAVAVAVAVAVAGAVAGAVVSSATAAAVSRFPLAALEARVLGCEDVGAAAGAGPVSRFPALATTASIRVRSTALEAGRLGGEDQATALGTLPVASLPALAATLITLITLAEVAAPMGRPRELTTLALLAALSEPFRRAAHRPARGPLLLRIASAAASAPAHG